MASTSSIQEQGAMARLLEQLDGMSFSGETPGSLERFRKQLVGERVRTVSGVLRELPPVGGSRESLTASRVKTRRGSFLRGADSGTTMRNGGNGNIPPKEVIGSSRGTQDPNENDRNHPIKRNCDEAFNDMTNGASLDSEDLERVSRQAKRHLAS